VAAAAAGAQKGGEVVVHLCLASAAALAEVCGLAFQT
jgi:hypothetical protein